MQRKARNDDNRDPRTVQALRRDAAVDGLSFSAREGAVTGFLGPNGAGKTTTLRMLLGLVDADRRHRHHRRPALRELAEPFRHVGAVLETDGFHPGRRARDHLRVLAVAAGLPLARVDEVLERGRPRRRRPTGASRASRSGCASASAWPARCSASPTS